MHLVAVLLITTVALKHVLALGSSNINTFVGPDGRSYYSSPLTCTSTSLLQSNAYNTKTKKYILRGDDTCCTLAETRNSCCFDYSTKQCRCDPNVDCGSITTTSSPSTTTTTTTVAPTILVDVTTAGPATTTTPVPTTTTPVPITTTPVPTTTIAVPTTTTPVPTTTTPVPTTTTPVPTTTTPVPTTTTAVPTTTTPVPTTTPPVPTTTSSTTTTVPTTTTVATTTTTTPATTTITPSTPTTSTSTTTSTTTTAAPTTTAFKSLCTHPKFRILNGPFVTDDCLYPGISSITAKDSSVSFCNAVLTVATVNGTLKQTFLTAGICKIFIEMFAEDNITCNINIGSQVFPIVKPMFTLVDGPDGTAFIDMDKNYISLLDNIDGCQRSACSYNNSTMNGLVDMTTCTILSWGTSNSDTFQQDGLHEVPVALNQGGCASITDTDEANTLCFRAVSGKNLICSADSGSPVYCKAPSNNELILMGVAILQKDCDETPEVKVLPFPG